MPRFHDDVRQAESGDVDLLFGDSITHWWEPAGLETWNKHYAHRKPANSASAATARTTCKMFPFSTRYGGVEVQTADGAGEHHVSTNENQWLTSDLTTLKRLRITYPT